MNREVFLSLLALDSYNRGYGQNVVLNSGDSTTSQDEAGRKIGNATVIDVPLPSGSIAAGFYAIAYNWNGATVISYRGTNFPSDLTVPQVSTLVSDVFNGWSLGAGFSPTSQGQLAIAFYEAVAKVDSIYDTNAGTTIFTGHSLGGGLAGYVGALGRGDSYGFDHMPFLQAAQAQAMSVAVSRALTAAALEFGSPVTITDLALAAPLGVTSTLYDAVIAFTDTFIDEWNIVKPYTSTMTGYYLDGEVLEYVRAIDGAVNGVDLSNVAETLLGTLSNIIGIEGTYSEDVVQKTEISNRDVDLKLGFISLHSMPLLTINMFGEKQWSTEGGSSSWKSSAKYIFPSLSSDAIGTQLGLDGYPGVASAGGKMSTMIAYSLLNDGEVTDRPFGDTAIRALFNDADDLGLIDASLPAFIDEEVRYEIGGIISEFAGLLAANKVLSTAWEDALSGIISIGGNQSGSVLNIDLSDTKWSLDSTLPQPHQIHSSKAFVESIFDASYGTNANSDLVDFGFNELRLWLAAREGNSPLTNPFDSIDGVSISLTPGVLFRAENSTQQQLIVGSDQVEQFTIIGSPAIVLAGGGNDIIVGNSGDDAIIGGDGFDRFYGGGGNDFLIGGGGFDTLDFRLAVGQVGAVSIRLVKDSDDFDQRTFEVTSGSDTHLMMGVEEIIVADDAAPIRINDPLRNFAGSGLVISLGTSALALDQDGVDLSNATTGAYFNLSDGFVSGLDQAVQRNGKQWQSMISSLFLSNDDLRVTGANSVFGSAYADALFASSGKPTSSEGFSALHGGGGDDLLIARGWESQFWGDQGSDS